MLVEGVEAWKAADVKAVAAYLRTPAPETTLALVGGRARQGRAGVAKAVARREGRAAALGRAPGSAAVSWVGEQFRLHGASAEPEACRLLLELVGEDMYELTSEVDKLATWAAG